VALSFGGGAMGVLSGWVGSLVETQFRKDQSGRVVFLPGIGSTGYYVDDASADKKIKSPMAIYTAARIFVELLGSLSCLTVTMAIAFADPAQPVAHKIKVALVVYFISSLPFMIFPRWLLGRLYREMISGICSSLSEVSAESMRNLQQTANRSRQIAILVLIGLSLVLTGIIVAVLVAHRG
jgi:hypothetical protein